MLCKQCGYYAEDEAIVCPQCGTLLRPSAQGDATGAESIRQGKRAREAVKNRPLQKQEAIRRRRSGASRATIPLSPVRDTRKDMPDFDDVRLIRESGIGDEPENQKSREKVERFSQSVYSDEAAREAQAAAYAATHAPGQNRKMINWFKVSLGVFILVVLTGAGGYFFLKKTEEK